MQNLAVNLGVNLTIDYNDIVDVQFHNQNSVMVIYIDLANLGHHNYYIAIDMEAKQVTDDQLMHWQNVNPQQVETLIAMGQMFWDSGEVEIEEEEIAGGAQKRKTRRPRRRASASKQRRRTATH